ncbi:MAG: hypothetical protein EAZ31_11220 [Cytophagia bacterium]|nr:MAG: hypothetical protein EAZ31_11220 [Cytophagia bacterium]
MTILLIREKLLITIKYKTTKMIELKGKSAIKFERKAQLEERKYKKRVKLIKFLDWLLKNYSTDTHEERSFYVDNTWFETNSMDIANKYIETELKIK